MFKSIHHLTFILSLCAVFLFGCGDDKPDASQNTTPPVSTTNKLSSDKNTDPAYRGTIQPEHFKTTVNFKWSGGLPLVNVSIQGKTYKFLFDTAAPTMLPEALVKELKLNPIVNSDTLHDSSGKKIQVALYTLPSLEINELKFKDFIILPSNFAQSFPLSCLGFDGILGYNFLQDMVVKLDLNNQKITLSDQPLAHDGYMPVDIQFEPRYGPLVNLNFSFGAAPFEIDTGKNTYIQLGDTNVIAEMKKQKYISREIQGAFVSSVGGTKQNNRQIDFLITDFSIDNKIPIKSFPVSVNQSGAFLIGEDFLKKFTIIIDFPGKKAFFKQVGEGDIEQGFKDTFGFMPMWDGKSGLFISAVTSNTPAAKVDLKPGDKIISLNGKKMDSFTQDKFCQFMLSSQNDPDSFEKQKTAKLTIQRGDQKPQEIELKK